MVSSDLILLREFWSKDACKSTSPLFAWTHVRFAHYMVLATLWKIASNHCFCLFSKCCADSKNKKKSCNVRFAHYMVLATLWKIASNRCFCLFSKRCADSNNTKNLAWAHAKRGRQIWSLLGRIEFLHFLLKEKWVVHFATFSAATHPMRVLPNSAWSGVEGAIVCWPWNLWSGCIPEKLYFFSTY